MRIVEDRSRSQRPPEGVWERVADPSRYLHFMSGFTRWEVASEKPTGEGARYRMLMRVGSAEVGGLVEVVEWDEAARSRGTRSPGSTSAAAGACASAGHGRTRIELRLPTASQAPASSASWPSASRRGPSAATCAARCSQLKRQVEHEQLRKSAAARRRAREATARRKTIEPRLSRSRSSVARESEP